MFPYFNWLHYIYFSNGNQLTAKMLHVFVHCIDDIQVFSNYLLNSHLFSPLKKKMKVFSICKCWSQNRDYNPMKPIMIGNNYTKMLPKIPSVFVIMAFPYSSRCLT